MHQFYQLKKGVESFQVVDGDFAGKNFFRGDLYREKEIPPQEKHKFEPVEPVKPEKKTGKPDNPSKGGDK